VRCVHGGEGTGGIRGFFEKKPGKKLSADEVFCATGSALVWLCQLQGIFLDGVRLWLLEFS